MNHFTSPDVLKMTYWIYIMNDEQLILSAKQTFDKIQSKIYGDIQSLLKYAKLNAYEILQAKNPSYRKVLRF